MMNNAMKAEMEKALEELKVRVRMYNAAAEEMGFNKVRLIEDEGDISSMNEPEVCVHSEFEEEDDLPDEISLADLPLPGETVKLEPIDVDMFVVPCSGHWLSSDIESNQKRVKELVRVNDCMDTEDEKVFGFWMTGRETVNSDNLGDHGFEVTVKETGEKRNAFLDFNTMPTRFFISKDDGDVVTLVLPIKFDIAGNEKSTVMANIKCNQKDYRYRHHGSFNQVLTSC